MRGIVGPVQQWPGQDLKTGTSHTRRSRSRPSWRSSGPPRWRGGRGRVGLLEGFRFHDVRPYLASLLIAAGADVKVVQARTQTSPHGRRWCGTGGSCGLVADRGVS